MRYQRAVPILTAHLLGVLFIIQTGGWQTAGWQTAGWIKVYAQQRPKLRPVRRDYLAGKFLLIPPDTRPVSIQTPRLIARLADHDIVMPPIALLGDVTNAGDPDSLHEWARKAEYSDVEGVVISLEMLTRGGVLGKMPDEATTKRRLGLIDDIRARNRRLVVYGLANEADSIVRAGLDLVAAGKLDFLLVGRRDDATAEGRPAGQLAMTEEITRRGVPGRAQVVRGMAAAPQLLIARLLNQRFGLSPKFWIGTSPSPHAASLAPLLLSQINAMDGRAMPGTPDAASRSDVVLFVNAPDTEDEGQSALLSTVATAVANNFRVALVDLAESAASREAFLAEIRRRKMLDQLIAYSADKDPEAAAASALAQAACRLVMMKFLRDDIDRLQRAERAQVELMLSRAMTDVLYASQIRPKLDTFLRDQLKVDPMQLGIERERAQLFAREEAGRLAEELFREQYLRNTHGILLATGERAVFELRALQRLLVRFSWGTAEEVELRAGVFIPLISIVPPESNHTTWELLDAEPLDSRLVRRFDSVYWAGLKTDVDDVAVQIHLNRRELAAEAFTIQSRRRSKFLRRIEIHSSSAAGASYALSRLEELGIEGRLTEDFTLTEKPAFAHRGVIEGFDGAPWSHRDRLDMIRFLGRVRMNRYYFAPKGDPLNREKWREPYSDGDLDRFKEMSLAGEESFVSIVYCLSPGRSVKYSSDDEFRLLASKLSSLYTAGLRHFLLQFDGSPETLEHAEDRERFKSVASAQAHLIRRAYEHLQRMGQGFDLSVMPGNEASRVGHSEYLRELGREMNPDVGVVWPAPDVTASAESNRIGGQAGGQPGWRDLTGHRVIILDSFLSNEGMEWRPFLGPKNAIASDLMDGIAGFISLSMNQAHVSMLPLATAADYYWDPKQYDSTRSLDHSIKAMFDSRSAAGVKTWSDVFRENRAHRHLFEPLFQRQPGEVDVPEIERTLARLEEALEALGMKRESGLMRGELVYFLRRARLALRRLANDPTYERLPDARYRLRAD